MSDEYSSERLGWFLVVFVAVSLAGLVIFSGCSWYDHEQPPPPGCFKSLEDYHNGGCEVEFRGQVASFGDAWRFCEQASHSLDCAELHVQWRECLAYNDGGCCEEELVHLYECINE